MNGRAMHCRDPQNRRETPLRITSSALLKAWGIARVILSVLLSFCAATSVVAQNASAPSQTTNDSDTATSDDLRRELEDVLAQSRFQTIGGALALKTYAAYQDEFKRLEKPGLQSLAQQFMALAALEADNRPAWDRALSQEQRVSIAESEHDHDAFAKTRESIRTQLLQKIRDDGRRLSERGYSVDLSNLDREPQSLSSPAVTVVSEGEIQVEYQFIDSSVFRKAFDLSADVLARRCDDTGFEPLLIALWCAVLRGDSATADGINKSIQSVLSKRNLTAAQKEEWQYLLAVLAHQRGQAESVAKFLEARQNKPPKSLWAMRALCVIRGLADQRLGILQASLNEMTRGAHPLASQVLTQDPGTIESVLDRYWTIAWAHSQCETESHSVLSSTSPHLAAIRSQLLVHELTSPSIMESWRPFSLLRLGTTMHAGVLVGDSETWQLMRIDDLRSRYPPMASLTRLARDLSGLHRTQIEDPTREFMSLGRAESENLAVVLLGRNGADALVPASEDKLAAAGDPANASAIKWIAVSIAGLIVTVVAIWLVKSKQVSAR